jgi:hypothetical protein
MQAFIGFICNVFLLTLIIIFCLAGLYGILNVSAPNYKDRQDSLKTDAFQWGLKTTRVISQSLLLIITPFLIFQCQWSILLTGHARLFEVCAIALVTTMTIGFIGALFTLFND